MTYLALIVVRQQLQKNGGGEGGASMSSMSSMSETIMLHNIPTLTDPQKDLAVSAGQEFEKGNYSQCLSIMTKLLKQRSCDPKVVHNHTVAAFYHSNQCSVRELKDGLNSACKLVCRVLSSALLHLTPLRTPIVILVPS